MFPIHRVTRSLVKFWNPGLQRDVEHLRCVIAVWKMTLDLRCLRDGR